MRSVRATKILVTVTAMFSLFVSAVSACACSHHQAVKAETESCHNSSHYAPPVNTSIESNYVGAECNCSLRTPVPAIVAKKDDKRIAVGEWISNVVNLPVAAAEFEIAVASDAPFEQPHSNYHNALLSSLPSRAPPRL